MAIKKMAIEMDRPGLETAVSRTRYKDALLPTHDHPDRMCRHGGRGCHARRHQDGFGPDRRKTHDHSFRLADHRQQGWHRRLADDRPDLRHALYRMALRERPEGKEIGLLR